MARKFRKSSINKVEIQPLDEENLTMITPDTDITKVPYQSMVSQQDYYSRMQASCFELDTALNDIVTKRLTGNNMRNMSDEDVIKAYSAMEKAKTDRTRCFIELNKQLADNDFFRKQQELDRLKIYGKNRIIDVETYEQGTIEDIKDENTQAIDKVEKNKRQHVIRLLQQAISDKIERGDIE